MLSRPKGLSEIGNKAYDNIMKTIQSNESIYTGGCKTFYSPDEWRKRDELYGLESELIIVYDGGDVVKYFNLDYDIYHNYIHTTKMTNELQKVGIYYEECTGWYSAIYKI